MEYHTAILAYVCTHVPKYGLACGDEKLLSGVMWLIGHKIPLRLNQRRKIKRLMFGIVNRKALDGSKRSYASVFALVLLDVQYKDDVAGDARNLCTCNVRLMHDTHQHYRMYIIS